MFSLVEFARNIFLLAFLIFSVTKPGLIGIEGSEVPNGHCPYTYETICEERIYNIFSCFQTGFDECYDIKATPCTKKYFDCCPGYDNYGSVCIPTSKECTDCYTLTDCQGKVTRLDSRVGVIRSDNYPLPYDNNIDCEWIVKGPRYSNVSLTVNDFQLQESEELCSWLFLPPINTYGYKCKNECLDWVILDGGDYSNQPRNKECGHKKVFKEFRSTSRTARIRFHTDGTVSLTGFLMFYTIEGGEDPKMTTTETPVVTISDHVTVVTTPKTTIVPSTAGRSTSRPICPGRLVWNDCPSCTRTCKNIRQPEEECSVPFKRLSDGTKLRACTPRCTCPEEYPIWNNLKCVTFEECLTDEIPTADDHAYCLRRGMVIGTCLRTCQNLQKTKEMCVEDTKTKLAFEGLRKFACVCPGGGIFLKNRCVTREACIAEFSKQCTGGKVWTSCVAECEKTCAPATVCTKQTRHTCKHGCICPPQSPYFHGGTCIKMCPIEKSITCGNQYYSPILKIIGGSNAIKGSWPWVVQIEKFVNGKFTLTCGGTLLCEKWVLTASHCFLHAGKAVLDKLHPQKYRLHVGKHHKRYNASDKESGMISDIIPKRIITHERYHTTTHVNDIALIELPFEVKMNFLIRPACIYATPDYFPRTDDGVRCIALGWGSDTRDGDTSSSKVANPILKQVEMSPRVYGLCNRLFQHFNIEKMHCVGGLKDHDTCAGDSGGPLMCRRKNRWYVDGVVSYGLKCGIKDEPGVYTRVSYYSKWIRGYTGNKCGNPASVWTP